MVIIQQIKCSDCGTTFEYDSTSTLNTITGLNEVKKLTLNKELVITAYLECPNFHTKPYKVKKNY